MARPDSAIAPMVEGDLDEVMAIEHSGHKSPWPRQVFVEELTRVWARVDVARIVRSFGASPVVGFCNYWLVKGEVHLLNIATHPGHRRRGYGRDLMTHLFAVARRDQCDYLTLEVRASNAPAIALYRSFGFGQVGLRPSYYAEDREDALVMARELAGYEGD